MMLSFYIFVILIISMIIVSLCNKQATVSPEIVKLSERPKRTVVVAAAKGVKTLHANNYREAADALLNRIEPGDALLVKASRGMALEKVLEIFYAEQKDAEE